jgi:hypothetical protein
VGEKLSANGRVAFPTRVTILPSTRLRIVTRPLSSADASRSPAGEMAATTVPWSIADIAMVSTAPESGCHRRTAPDESTYTTDLPVASSATTGARSGACRHSGSSTGQMRTVPSRPAEASILPEPAIDTDSTKSRWPSNRIP